MNSGNLGEVFRVFLRLGLTSFGGPVAHLGYFHEAFVQRRKWLTARDYGNLVAICQFLPGPASSQVCIGIGLARAGMAGAFLAWIAFLLPSVLVMVAFGYGVTVWRDSIPPGLLTALKTVAVAVVAQAVWRMANQFCPDRVRVSMAALGAAGSLLIPSPLAPLVMMGLAAVAGQWLALDDKEPSSATQEFGVGRGLSVFCLALLAVLLAAPALLSGLVPALADHQLVKVFLSFFSSGSLVFGGGHVVLPLLQATVVSPGWVTSNEFLAGYGAAQAVPGPLFSLSAYLGTVLEPHPSGWQGALFCLAAIYLPSFLLLFGVLPFWSAVQRHRPVQKAQMGINAAVVGVLLAALYQPIWVSAVTDARTFLMALAAFTGLVFWRVPSWLLVIVAAAVGWLWLT